MNKIVLGGDMIEIDIDSNVLVSDECDTIEINDAMKVAMEDMDSEGELSELDMVETEEFIEFG